MAILSEFVFLIILIYIFFCFQVAKATYAVLGLIIAYNVLKPSKK